MALLERHVAAGSDDCAHGSVMSASQSQLLSPKPSTHSACPRKKVVERRERQEGVVHEENGLRAQTTPLLRSILVLLSCSVFPAKSTGVGFGAALVSTTALVCLVWFCWCRRTSRYFPFFCFRKQRIVCPQWYILCVSPRSYRISWFFHLNMWITDPEVDSRLSGHVLWPLVSGSLLFGARCSPFEHLTTDFPGLQEIFTYSALFGLTVDTCCVILRGFCKNLTRFET